MLSAAKYCCLVVVRVHIFFCDSLNFINYKINDNKYINIL